MKHGKSKSHHGLPASSIDTSPITRYRLKNAFFVIQAHFANIRLPKAHLHTNHFVMNSLFSFSILAILSNAIATPVANTLDNSDYVNTPVLAGTDVGIIAQPDCGDLTIKCCLGRYNPVTHFVGPPCGVCNVPHIFSIPSSREN